MEATRRPARILLTGDFAHPDFTGVRAFLASCARVDLVDACLDDVPSAAHDIIAICQSRPGQYTQVQVEHLHRGSPLARLLAILGSWCEGELRSGRPWHGVERIYWYAAIGHLQWLLDHSAGPSGRMQSVAERIEREMAVLPAAAAGTQAVIVAKRRGEYEALADVCRVLKIAAHWQRTWTPDAATTPPLVLLAADDLQVAGLAAAACNYRRVWPAARLIALLNFPRRDEIEALQAAGFDQVLGKPLLVTDLLGCLGIGGPKRLLKHSGSLR